MNGTDRLLGHRAGRVGRKARDTEVGDLDGAILQQHDIMRLDIAVNDTVLMRVL